MILIAKDLHKVYKNGRREVCAVNGINLEIKKGEATAIVGPSGAGKSTLLHLIGGLDHPTSGEVLMDGVNLYRLSDSGRAKIRNRRVGFVFQFYHLLPEFTALENVMMPALIRGYKGREGGITGNRGKDKGRELMEMVGLGDRMSHKPGELSGGESQRVAIARALINDPEILLCDEPTGNLDSKTSQSIYKLLLELKLRKNITLVIVTHDESISSQTDRLIRIKDGKIV